MLIQFEPTEQLDSTKVTGIDEVDKLQDSVNNVVAGQVGQNGLAQAAGDLASKEGANRAERQGKGEDGSYVPGGESASNAASSVAQGGKNVAGGVASGVQGVGSTLGGALGGGNKTEGEQKK